MSEADHDIALLRAMLRMRRLEEVELTAVARAYAVPVGFYIRGRRSSE